MKAAQAASKVRNAMKKQGINPNGLVQVRSNDYITEITVDLRRVYNDDEKYAVESAINEIETEGNFTWNVM